MPCLAPGRPLRTVRSDRRRVKSLQAAAQYLGTYVRLSRQYSGGYVPSTPSLSSVPFFLMRLERFLEAHLEG